MPPRGKSPAQGSVCRVSFTDSHVRAKLPVELPVIACFLRGHPRGWDADLTV
jgi:hypothetical protein